MKITIYELLGLIKDGKAPKKIKGRLDMIYTFNACENDYVDDEAGKLLFYNLMHFRNKCLNDEVEIIEEDKQIEKLENEIEFYSYSKYEELKKDVDKIIYILKAINLTENKINNLNNKLNEIIDKVNSLEKNQ